jgi:hypothetical protein
MYTEIVIVWCGSQQSPEGRNARIPLVASYHQRAAGCMHISKIKQHQERAVWHVYAYPSGYKYMW